MDGQRFDGITRAFASRLSRREALRTTGAGFAGAALAALTGRMDADARPTGCRQVGKACGRGGDKECCFGSCCGGTCCGDGELCAGGACCPAAQTCGETCCPPETVGCTAEGGCFCGNGLVYENGQCVPAEQLCRPGTGVCAPLGEACGGLPCCNGVCAGGACQCVGEGGACGDSYDCCAGAGYCIGGVCTIGTAGTACKANADCGPGLYCTADGCDACNGTCEPCYSGEAVCPGLLGDIYVQCGAAMRAACCIADPLRGFPGWGYCCVPGENCPGDPCGVSCPTELALSGVPDPAACNGL